MKTRTGDLEIKAADTEREMMPATIDETIDHLRALIRALPTEGVPPSMRFARASLDEILVQLRGLLQ